MKSEESAVPISTPSELADHCRAHAAGVVRIKPKVLFMKTEARFDAPVPMKLHVPSSGLGSVTLLEAAALVSLIKLVAPKRIFEFGTFLGYSSALLVENSSDECQVHSLDLGEGRVAAAPEAFSDADVRSDGDINDEYLRGVQGSQGPRYTRALSAGDSARLHLINQDSRTFDPSAHGLEGAVDLVFVDGGHDTETVTADTATARRMIGESGVIVWHDYGSTIHDDVTRFIDGLAADTLFIRVEHTMLVLLLVGQAGRDFLEAGR